jgi:hypothetical protein
VVDSNLYGAFRVKWWFLVFAGSLFGAGKPFFVPSPAIRFAERAEGVKLDEGGLGLIGDPRQSERSYCGRGAGGGCWISLMNGT